MKVIRFRIKTLKNCPPLQCGHINMQRRYSFTVPESVSKGELRAFNEKL